MNDDYQNNGYTPDENTAPESGSQAESDEGKTMGNDFQSNGYAPNENTAPENGSSQEKAYQNPSQDASANENDTTYHYSYTGQSGNNTNYYQAPGNQGYNYNEAQQNGAGNYTQNQQYGAGSYTQNQQYGAGNYAQSQQNGAQQEAAPQNKKAKKQKQVEYDAFGNPIKPKKNKTGIIIAVVIAVCVIAAVIGIVVAATGDSQSDTTDESTTSSAGAQIQESTDNVATTDSDGNYTVAGIAENFMDCCVGISVYTESSSYDYFSSYGSSSDSSSERTLSGEGSGIIMLEDGDYTYIMTCAHVISDGSSFTVTLNNGDEYEATMVGYDSQTDIGVLRITETGLQVAEFADSDSVVVGEQVVAIGCPGGLEFLNSVTSGYVSAVSRPISSSIGYDQECIQTDAAINPGNSGGALFNMSGQVIGVNSSKIASTEYEGMGFAVPSNTAVATANSLIQYGYVEGRAQIGITYTSIESYSNATAILNALEALGYSDANGTMVINEINSDSDLASKDVQEYDMIVAVNGETLTSTDIMTSLLAECSPGDTITLTIARIENNQITTFDVECTLTESTGD